MKKAQHSKAFFLRAGSTKPKAPIRDNEHHHGGYQPGSPDETVCVFPEKGAFDHHLTLLLAKMDHCHAAYFSQEEQIIIMEGYEEYKKILTAKSNTAAANKGGEDCWQNTADHVNS